MVETNHFEEATIEDLRDAMGVCNLETVTAIHTKLERMANRQYEYALEFLDEIKVEAERPKGKLGGDFESMEELLNRYAKNGWELDKIYGEPRGKVIRTYLIFKREKMD